MIIGVFGPRDDRAAGSNPNLKGSGYPLYKNYGYIADSLDDYDAVKIVSGGGHGVEQLALRYAMEKGIDHEVIPPNMAANGDNSFRIRNREIIQMVDLVVLFWDGKDRFYHELLYSAVEQQKLLHLRHVE